MPLKREPVAVSALPLGTVAGETLVSNGCQLGSKPRPGSYSSALLKVILLANPPATSTLPLGSSVTVGDSRAAERLLVKLHVPLAGSYSSALFSQWKIPSCEVKKPAATSTLPLGSTVAV